MNESFFKGYWMVTNRCNLRCSYCVLENAPDQLRRELDLEGKKELLSHLYHNLGFRRITLSGGEVSLIGKRPPQDFIELLRFMRQFRSADPKKHLEVELYTNGAFIDQNVASEMEGVVDTVAVTIDSSNNEFLTQIGRNSKKFPHYYERIMDVCGYLSSVGIELKLHSVVSEKNHLDLSNQVKGILQALEDKKCNIACWKFYQYMSYDVPDKDRAHAIPAQWYNAFVEKGKKALSESGVRLHFKNNEEMDASLFNILSYGNAQYMVDGDTWSSSRRTEDLRSYRSMEELFSKTEVDETRYRKFHEIVR